ncbi:hypothetical protein FH063_003524 [Azospirillum argentinense]|uniref:Uncharacterized protein n=1 Tax=Azospirillum argentinense TaxID=2970906 RepID=A0A5B0KXL8_9PROT|nr:hypothetical protein FH063_003524 [Azospirillum argentinense]
MIRSYQSDYRHRGPAMHAFVFKVRRSRKTRHGFTKEAVR